MSKTKNFYWDEAKDYLTSVTKEVNTCKLNVKDAVKKCLDANIAWGLIGFDTDYDLEGQLEEYFEVAKETIH